MKHRFLILCLILAFLTWAAPGFGTDEFPSKPIMLIVCFAPGGGLDLSSRTIADYMQEFLGQPLVSNYKTGAGGAIGAAFGAKSKPDGYTILAAGSSMIIPPLVNANAGYALEELVPIGGYARCPFPITVKLDGPYKSLADVVAAAKNNPGKLKYASFGALSNGHFTMELFCKIAGIRMQHIPFPGSPQANAAVMGGHVDIAITGGTGGLYKSGSIKVVAVPEKERMAVMPDVPTLTELGFPLQIDTQHSLMAPKGMPKEIVGKYYDAMLKASAKYGKEIAARLENLELFPSFVPPEELMKKYQRDNELFIGIAKDLGVYVK